MSRQSARAPSQRQLRVGEEVRHALAEALERGEIRDPAVKGVAVTVTEVRISPDLKNATAFVVPLGGGDAAPVVEALLLTDQLLFLREAGLEARLVPLFDPRISPRNMALVAAKREGSEGG